MNPTKIILTAAIAMAITACGTQKSVTTSSTTTSKTTVTNKNEEKARIDFLDKVNSNAAYQKNIAASITFRISQGEGKEISVPGQLRMRKDQIIRISLQVPIIGSEVGRLEFSKDFVVIIDRIHKQYVKANYKDVGFLRDNGITFYSLQALFWNQLILPGKTSVGYTDLDKFSANLNVLGPHVPVSITDGKLKYTWTTERSNGVIDKALVEYNSSNHGKSSLTWDYSNFKSQSSKLFPYNNAMTIVTPANGKTKTLKASYEINNLKTSDDWDASITIPSQYKQVSVEEVLGKLTRN